MVKLRLLLIYMVMFLPSCVVQDRLPNKLPYTTIYDTITIEIVSPPEKKPSKEAFFFLIEKIKQYNICKNITITYRDDISFVLPIWTSTLIRCFESGNRELQDFTPKDRDLALFICYLPGRYDDDDRIAGLKYGNTSFAIFPDIASNEGVTLMHEFGHILRIANRRKHPLANPDRPRHCNDDTCIMYWQTGKHRTDLDAECLDEIRDLIAATN